MSYLTIVYEITHPNQVRALLDQSPWSACSHTHAVRECDQAKAQREHMQARRDELVEALRGLLDALPSSTNHPAIRAARQAIAKATGGAA